MRKLIISLITGLVLLVGTALAGPVEKQLRKEGHHKILYDITAGSQMERVYGQGTAIGPHHILTARHVVEKGSIEVLLKRKGFNGYKTTQAFIVAKGKEGYDNDWAIIETDDKLKYWKALELGKAHIGDEVYHISGRFVKWAFIIPMNIIGKEALHWDISSEETDKILADRFEGYILFPTIVLGDSGSSVVNANGELIGIAVATDEKIGLVVKAEKFKRAYKKYRGK